MKTEDLSDLIIEGVVHITTIYTEAGSKGKRSERERWAIIQKFEGETVYRSKEKEYLSDKNHMVILPKGCSYEWECLKAGRFCAIEFLSPLTFDGIFYFPDIDGESVRTRMQTMERQRNAGADFHRLEKIKDTYSLILKLLSYAKKRYTPSEKAKRLEPAVSFMLEHYTEALSNDFLASLCGISTVYFRKLFTEVYGLPPMQYISETKVKKAKEMLQSDFGSITEVALSLGYQSIYDFSRDFKKRTGLSPKAFAEGEQTETVKSLDRVNKINKGFL